MFSLVIGASIIAWSVVENDVAVYRANAAGNAQLSAQRAADALADKTRALFNSLDPLVSLASLILRLSDCCDATAKQAARQTLQDAMQQNPLALRSLELRAPSGEIVLSLGEEPAGKPPEPDLQAGPGLPWLARGGRQVAHFTRLLPNNPGYSARFTLDVDVLARAANAGLPPGIAAEIFRLFDGAELTPSDQKSKLDKLETPHFVDAPLLRKFSSSDRGWIAGLSAAPGTTQQPLAFVTLNELGLVVTTRIRQDQTLGLSQGHSQILRLIPISVFMIGTVAVVGILLAISRRRTRRELDDEQRASLAETAARQELEQLISCSPAILYRGRVLPNGEFVREFLSPNTREVTGWESYVLADPEEIWNLTPEEDRLLRGKNYLRAAKDGRAAVEYRFQLPDGGYSWLRNEAMVIRKLPDGSTELAGAITNVSREREMSAYAAMQNRLASLGEIAASLAHELTQPMTVIGIASALARNAARTGSNPDDLDRHLTAIETQTDRASDIIRHLRLYGRADGGPLANIKLRQAVQGAFSLVGTALREAEIETSIDLSDDLPEVRARLVQVEQILVNLLINARDAMSANPTGTRRIMIRSVVHDDLVRLQVEDTGPGVPASLIERLFEPFYTTKAPGEGTGLGLALCQTMMRQVGGSISAANGRYGAIFSLEFPIPAAMRGTPPSASAISAQG